MSVIDSIKSTASAASSWMQTLGDLDFTKPGFWQNFFGLGAQDQMDFIDSLDPGQLGSFKENFDQIAKDIGIEQDLKDVRDMIENKIHRTKMKIAQRWLSS